MSTLPTGGWNLQVPIRGHRTGAAALLIILAALVLGLAARPAGAQTEPGAPTEPAPGATETVAPTTTEAPAPATTTTTAFPADPGYVSVVTLTGLIDPILADLIDRSLVDAREHGARAVIFQTDLEGSVIPDAQMAALLERIRTSPVPVHVWVGPTGSRLTGRAAWLAVPARSVAMAPGTTVGDAPALAADAPDGSRADALRNGLYDTAQARSAGITSADAPTLGDFYVGLREIVTKEVTRDGETRREPVTQAVFSQLSLLAGFMHTAASPAVAYLLLTVGLSLLIFELFTAGVGVAGVIGAGSLVLACFGLATLPTHWWGIALLVASMLAFAVDVQTGVPRFWTGLGLALYTLGSLTLYDGVTLSWLTIAVGIIGVALTFLAGMPSMVRTRFSTPTIGREWMKGELGRAITDINPDGVVQIKGAPWRAYTNRATPIEQLDKVRVVGIEGLVLEVEPEEGGARDYRERGPRHEAAEPA